jgi:hypothetical protein
MFNLDDIEEPEWANLDARIVDAVWNVDPEKKSNNNYRTTLHIYQHNKNSDKQHK